MVWVGFSPFVAEKLRIDRFKIQALTPFNKSPYIDFYMAQNTPESRTNRINSPKFLSLQARAKSTEFHKTSQHL